MGNSEDSKTIERLRKLEQHTLAISAERDQKKSIELILFALKDVTNAEGGTFYTLSEGQLAFEVFVNTHLGITMGGSTGTLITYAPLNLYDEMGNPNHANIACHCALTGEVVNIDDAYQDHVFNFSGTKAFDKKTGYQTKSVLALPLKTFDNRVLGVIQLLNAKDEQQQTISFSAEDIEMARFLSTHAASTLSNYRLNQELQQLFVSMAEVLAYAIDNKSSYTGKHCHRVPAVAMMTLDAVLKNDRGPLKHFRLNEEQIKEMELASLLHDCGKVTTPSHIMDKSTKMETIFDRIHLLETRFEVLKRDVKINYLKEKIAILKNKSDKDIRRLRKDRMRRLTMLAEDLEFLKEVNKGLEKMQAEWIQRIKKISNYKWRNPQGEKINFLTVDEVENLSVIRGTLTEKERKVINDHIVVTQKMLGQMKFPSNLKNIPEIAGSHHERIDGQGHPRGLKGGEMSVQARILCLADAFEALTANDRPYKSGKTLQETLEILGKMVQDGHFDKDIFTIFIDCEVYLEYAQHYLRPEQYRQIDLTRIPSYTVPDKREKTETIYYPVKEKKAA
jgi:HD-GYP domain-containing protein (c-di-GMP phosphodiesterase class II)